MKIINQEHRLCTCCMSEHDIKLVQITEDTKFKSCDISYDATYYYCDLADELYADEKLMLTNDINLKDAYRKSVGLLTTSDINSIRSKYGISQSDLCTLLGWGGKTITRYESHQVQDKAHDYILKKLDSDPEWYLSLLIESQPALSTDSYNKYFRIAQSLFENSHDYYLKKAIESSYSKYHDNSLQGNTSLSIDKAIDVIRYFSTSSKVSSLYTLKLAKLMWYADALSYKKRDHSITGLVYEALPSGICPLENNSLLELDEIPRKQIELEDTITYYLHSDESLTCPNLKDDDLNILNNVINKLGMLSNSDILARIHNEEAYLLTTHYGLISFELTKNLKL